MSDKAHLAVLSGVFYENGADLMIADDELGAVSIETILGPVLGKRVALIAHHCPPDPPFKDRWGGGSCLLEPSGHCPCGHHERPDWLYSQTTAGVLQRGGDGWTVTKPDGEVVSLRLEWLVGHTSQLVVTALPNLDELKAELEKEMKNPTVEGIQARLTEMRDLLSMVNSEKDNL